MQATDIYEQLAAALCRRLGPQALLEQLLEPIVCLSGARVGSAHLRTPGSNRLQKVAVVTLQAAAVGHERIVTVLLPCRGQVSGEIRLTVPAEGVIEESTAAFHRSIGALLGLALHDAGRETDGRQALVADVHDGIAQTLAFARMRLPLLEQAVRAHDEAAALRYGAEVRQAIGTAHTNLRAILSQGSAPMDPRGLMHALQSSVRSFREQTQVELSWRDGAPGLCLSQTQEAQVYLVVQEALANVAKHSGARHAWLTIDQLGDRIDVVVEDDGTGLPVPCPVASPSHLGIDIMRQRAARLGGELEIRAREGGGTRLGLVFSSLVTARAKA